MLDLKLDPETWDLAIEGGDFVWIFGDEELIQHINIRLLFILGEWFLDPTRGFVDKKRMFGKNAPESYFRAKLLSEVEAPDGIAKGSAVIESLVQTGRNRSVTWSARKSNGDPIRGTATLGLRAR